jgi:hypothetical protein
MRSDHHEFARGRRGWLPPVTVPMAVPRPGLAGCLAMLVLQVPEGFGAG